MQDRQEDGALDREPKPPAGDPLSEHVGDATLPPQALEDECRPDGDGLRRDALATRMRVEHEQLVGKAAETFDEAIELAGGAELVQTSQPMEHPLNQAPIHALVFDEQQVRAVTVGLRADEHGFRVSSQYSSSQAVFKPSTRPVSR